MKRLSVAVVLAIVILVPTAEAAVRRICLVAYETRTGYSAEYKLEVQFSTGQELNKATKSFNYDSFSNYALIWFGKGEVAILEIKDMVINVDEEFDNEDFRKLFWFTEDIIATQINSKSRTKWRIKGQDFLRWIDPRAE
jgi:hypothetical protein